MSETQERFPEGWSKSEETHQIDKFIQMIKKKRIDHKTELKKNVSFIKHIQES